MADVVRLNARAVLLQNPQGSIHLFYENRLYRRTDLVPDDRVPNGHALAPINTAGDYVIAYMVDKHGAAIEDWPDIARQYLVQDEFG